MTIKENALGYQHMGIFTNDMDKSLEFYTSLGFREIYRAVGGGHLGVFIEMNGMVIELYGNGEAVMAPGAVDHIAIQVRDIEDAFNTIKAGGYDMIEKEIVDIGFWENGMRYFMIWGPNREKIEFCECL